MARIRLRIPAVAALLALAAAGAAASGTHAGGHDAAADSAIGKPGVAGKSVRTINVDMTDNMRFTPSDISVKQGETVRFVVRNVGVLKHELVLGTGKDLRAHYEAMMKNPEMEHARRGALAVHAGRQGRFRLPAAGPLRRRHEGRGERGEGRPLNRRPGAQPPMGEHSSTSVPSGQRT